MTSNVTTYSDQIDEQYPVAGRDNNSQGFRDNFFYIKQSLTNAGTEITDLQNNTSKVNDDNNFNGFNLENAIVNNFYDLVNEQNVSSNIVLDAGDGAYHLCNILADTQITLSGWNADTGVAHKIAIHLVNTDVADHTVTFTATGGATIKILNFPGGNLSASVNVQFNGNVSMIQAWSPDGGSTILLHFIGTFTNAA